MKFESSRLIVMWSVKTSFQSITLDLRQQNAVLCCIYKCSKSTSDFDLKWAHKQSSLLWYSVHWDRLGAAMTSATLNCDCYSQARRLHSFIAKRMNRLHSHTHTLHCVCVSERAPCATTEHVRHSRLVPPDAHTHPAHSRGLSQSDGSAPLSISWPAGGGASLCKQRKDAAPLFASSTATPPLCWKPARTKVVQTQSRTQIGPALLLPAGAPVSLAKSGRWTCWALAHSIHSHGVSSSIGPHVTFDPGTLTGSSEDHKGVYAAKAAYSRSDAIRLLQYNRYYFRLRQYCYGSWIQTPLN